jgi:tRNA A-37 threonylcarbamoyl transferase component Bud32
MAASALRTCRACGGAHPARTPCEGEPDPRVQTVLEGKYRIVRVLGRGGMGTVYEARHVELGRRFAIKFLRPELAANRAVLRRFENEARAAGSLEHPNLVAVTDIGRAMDRSPYLVMEFLAGQDCAELLARLGPLPPRRASDIVLQACLGLAVAHDNGIVHRDIKPENLCLVQAGDGTDLVKVLDFGIAKLREPEATAATGAGVALGTCCYMSPEQIRSAAEVDARSDVWSLGVVLYELLSGRKPFDGGSSVEALHQILHREPQPLAELRPELPPELVRVVEQALEKDLDQRLATVTALGEALASYAGRPWVSTPAGRSPRMVTSAGAETVAGSVADRVHSTPPGVSARKWAMGAGAVVLVLGFGAAGLTVARGGWSPGRADHSSQTDAAHSGAVVSRAPLSARSEDSSAMAQRAVRDPPAGLDASAMPSASGSVRRLSEHLRDSSDRDAMAPPPPVTAAARPSAAVPVAPPSATTPGKHDPGPPAAAVPPITIDPQNPY